MTAALDGLDFETKLKIGRVVRGIAKTPRVITFGGCGVHLDDLLASVEEHDGFIGVNASASGVHNEDYHCIHMGYGVDEMVQVPYLIGERGVDVHLLGKVADVCTNHFGESESIVDARTVLELVRDGGPGFICTNVRETDLMGHHENVPGYAEKLRVADGLIGKIRAALAPEDALVVMTGSTSGRAGNVLKGINDVCVGTDGGGSVLAPRPCGQSLLAHGYGHRSCGGEGRLD